MRNLLHFIFLLLSFETATLGFFSYSARAADKVDLNDPRSSVEREEYSEEQQHYQMAPSRWSVGFRMAQDSFPTKAALGQLFQFYGEWMLPFQKVGLFSVGAHLSSFPIRARNTQLPYAIYENMLNGLQFRYQYKFSANPLLVPIAGLSLDYFRIRRNQLSPDVQLSGITFGLGAGIMLNLGFLDSSTAREAYQSINLTKAYLTAEIQTVSASTDLINISGNLYLFGLRTEFE